MRAICLYWGPSASLVVRSACFSCPAARAATRASSARHRVRVGGFDRLSLKSMPTVTVARRTRPQSTACALRDNSFRCTERPWGPERLPHFFFFFPFLPYFLASFSSASSSSRRLSASSSASIWRRSSACLASSANRSRSSWSASRFLLRAQTDRHRIDTSNLAACLSMRTCGMRGVRVACVAHAPQVRVMVLW